MPVDGGDADAGLFGDAVEGSGAVFVGEDGAGRGEDPCDAGGRVGAQCALGHRASWGRL